jgi:hypothetical protein
MSKKIISARLDEKTIWELEFLRSSMGNKKTTEVLTDAIHHLYASQSQKQQKRSAFDFLREAGFIGAIEGEENESIEYKKHITKRIRKKR